MNLKIKTYHLFWTLIPLVFLMIMLGMEQTMEVQMHDTYFVFLRWHFACFVALVFAILGGVHWLLREFLMIDELNWFHAIITTLAVFVVLLMMMFLIPSGRYNADSVMSYVLFLYGFILVFSLAQFLFLGNVVAALVRGKK